MPPARPKTAATLLALTGILAVLAFASLVVGSVAVPFADIAAILIGGGDEYSSAHTAIVRTIRPPRLLLAILVGASLSLSGAVMQGFFQNPMADPYIIGVSSGAGLGATAALALSIDFWFAGVHSVSVLAFAGALVVVGVVYAISLRAGRVPVTVLLLTGIAIGSMAAAVTSFLMITTEAGLHRILFWLMGSFAGRRWEHVNMIWPWVLASAVILQFFARDLNLLLQGEEQARYLGVAVERIKLLLLVITALLTAAAVAVSGVVGFVGLLVPHLMRLIVGPDHRRLFPASVLGGAILMVAADMVARTAIAPAEIPIGVITALLGCPFFLFLLSRRSDLAL